MNLYPRALFLLAEVERNPYPADLAWALLLPAPTVSLIIRHVEDLGLLVREIDSDDRRRYRLKLTPAGRDALESGSAALHEVVQRRMGRLSHADLHELDRLLSELERITADGSTRRESRCKTEPTTA